MIYYKFIKAEKFFLEEDFEMKKFVFPVRSARFRLKGGLKSEWNRRVNFDLLRFILFLG